MRILSVVDAFVEARVGTVAVWVSLLLNMGKKGPKSPRSKAQKGNQNASGQRSEPGVARGDQSGASTSSPTLI